MKEKIPVIVFGTYVAAYSIIKGLNKIKVKTYLVTNQKEGFIIGSSLIEEVFIISPLDNDFIFHVNNICKKIGSKVMLVIGGSDEYLDALSNNRNKLSQEAILTFPDKEKVNLVRNKIATYKICEEIGVGYPKAQYFKIDDLINTDQLDFKLEFPVLFKFVRPVKFLKAFGMKAVVVNNKEELKQNAEEYHNYGNEVMLSEYIPGPDANLHNLITVSNPEGKVIAYFSNRKVRTDGAFASASCMVNFYSEELVRTGIKLIEKIGYCGVANPEFKLDERDGKLKLMEINGRPTLTISHAFLAKINIPEILYKSFLNKPFTFTDKFLKTKKTYKWILLQQDLKQAKDAIAAGNYSWFKYIKSIIGHKMIIEPFCFRDVNVIKYFFKQIFK